MKSPCLCPSGRKVTETSVIEFFPFKRKVIILELRHIEINTFYRGTISLVSKNLCYNSSFDLVESLIGPPF